MGYRTKTVVETESFEIFKRSSRGKKLGRTYYVRMKREHGGHVDLTLDELFDLAEALDDICDAIEDGTE